MPKTNDAEDEASKYLKIRERGAVSSSAPVTALKHSVLKSVQWERVADFTLAANKYWRLFQNNTGDCVIT